MSDHVGYAVIDFETTGFNARGRDRAVELAIVLLDRHLEVESVFSTLINPGRDLGATHIHKIHASWVLEAPPFSDLAQYIHSIIQNRALIAHNASFDVSFLVEETKRAGLDASISDENYACTLQLSKWVIPQLGNRKLSSLLAHLGITNTQEHSALGDALATAEALKVMANLRPDVRVILELLNGVRTENLAPVSKPPVGLKTRPSSQELEDSSFIARLVSRLSIRGQNPSIDEYFDLLSSALIDADLSEQEVSDLLLCAERLELGVEDVAKAHQIYFQALGTQAWSDGILTQQEQTQIERIAFLLGIGTLETEQVRQGQFNRVDKVSAFSNPFEVGALVALTGTMTPSKAEIAEMLKQKGIQPVDSLSKKVAVLVAADTDSLSGKASKARKWGIPIVAAGAVSGLLEQL